MLPYWLLFGLFSVGAFYFSGRRFDPSRVNLPLAIAAIFAALMVGLRYKVGADWGPYREIFWDMRFTSLPNAVTRSDPAFGLLNWSVRRSGLDLWVVNLVCASVFVAGLYQFAKRQADPWVVFAVAVPYLVIVVGMGYNRQATALGFSLLALNAIQNRSFRWFLAYMLLAATFHRSAIILLPIIAISYSQNRFLTSLMALAAGAIGYFFIVAPELDTYVARYSGAEQGAIESEGTLVRVLMNVLPAVLFFAFRSRFPAHQDYLKVWRNFAFLAIASLGAYAYFGNNTAVDRLSIYLTPLQLFVLSNLPAVLGGKRGSSILVLAILVAFSLAVQFVWLVFAGNARDWIPYQLFPI